MLGIIFYRKNSLYEKIGGLHQIVMASAYTKLYYCKTHSFLFSLISKKKIPKTYFKNKTLSNLY